MFCFLVSHVILKIFPKWLNLKSKAKALLDRWWEARVGRTQERYPRPQTDLDWGARFQDASHFLYRPGSRRPVLHKLCQVEAVHGERWHLVFVSSTLCYFTQIEFDEISFRSRPKKQAWEISSCLLLILEQYWTIREKKKPKPSLNEHFNIHEC